MRGHVESPAATAVVWPPGQYASVLPSASPREQIATPAATSYFRSLRPVTSSPVTMPVDAHSASMILRCVSGVTPLPEESGWTPKAVAISVVPPLAETFIGHM